MPTLPLPLTSDPRDTAWRAVVDAIQADDTIRSLGVLWRLPEDTEFDDGAPRDVLTVRVVPVMSDVVTPVANVGWGKQCWETTIALSFEVMVPGDLSANAASFWAAVENAALGAGYDHAGRMAHNQRLADAGCAYIDQITPALTAMDSEVAMGSMLLTVWFEK